ncbi:MAG: protein translocase subunit SecD [Myxococcota bacterium]|nr:protein translocase subunit SecD [Myxococcota bacterium]
MSPSTRWRVLAVAGTLLLLGWFAAANFVSDETRTGSGWIPDSQIRLGLDLRGGIHWVLGPQLDAAVDAELDSLSASLGAFLEEDGVALSQNLVQDRELVLEAGTSGDVDALRRAGLDTRSLRVVREEGNRLAFALTPEASQAVREAGMRQVLEVLRRRIDDPIKGVPESVVTRQGTDRVLVQIPGKDVDRERARGLLRKTGHLEFKLVRDQAPTEELLRAKYPDGLPEGTEVVPEKDSETERILNVYLVPTSAALTGQELTNAFSSLDNRFGWIVNFQFNSEGARRFAKLSGDNIGEQLAIVLDGEVASAPRLEDRIGGGRGFVRGRFTADEASELAIILRAGSLPIPIQIEEERTVGPALGQDSIERGVRAAGLGLLLVIVFAAVYYRLSGVYAAVALLANLVLLVGIMSMATATLTLPGIAGLVLTVGMAVDANVIIFERIREELRLGKVPRAAIRTGFNKATWTILDANITTLVTAIVLFNYGTGPIKGFAVTLSIGIVTSVFAALVITRLLFEIYPGNRAASAVSI